MTELNPPERQRVYTFPGKEFVVIAKVTHFLARESGSHRLKTGDGALHIVPAGWLHIQIDADDWTL